MVTGVQTWLFRSMNAQSLQLVQQYLPQLRPPLADAAPWHVLLEHAAFEHGEAAQHPLHTLLETSWEQGLLRDAVVAESLAQTQALWQVREGIPLAQAAEGLNVKHDISVPTSAMPAFVESTNAALAAAFAGVRLVTFGHLGDGNLHYNVQAPVGMAPAAFLQQHEAANYEIGRASCRERV